MKVIKAARRIPGDNDTNEISGLVAAIIDDVRARGDDALRDYSERFDGSRREYFRTDENETSAALASLNARERAAMEEAIRNVKTFSEAEKAAFLPVAEFEVSPGIFAGRRVIPVDSVLCYVPGGNYPLFSSAIMLITQAKIAGVRRIAAASPPVKGTNGIHPFTLAAMSLSGADEIYALGGVQAVAAFAYGTKEIKPVSLIVGPGNAYVAEAKRQCYGRTGIDFIAGPSEIMIIADRYADPEFVAADLLAQCEHDKNARASLVSTDETLAASVTAEIEKRLAGLPAEDIASLSWSENGEIFIATDLTEAAEFADGRAPEHLELHIKTPETLIPLLRNYGALFAGERAAEVFGDYAAGPNHTLPTSGAARYSSGVWTGTFLKSVSVQRATPAGSARLAGTAAMLAGLEGLHAHARAARLRGER